MVSLVVVAAAVTHVKPAMCDARPGRCMARCLTLVPPSLAVLLPVGVGYPDHAQSVRRLWSHDVDEAVRQ